jgi:hypothetical protein
MYTIIMYEKKKIIIYVHTDLYIISLRRTVVVG